MSLVVTTSRSPNAALIARAEEVAATIGCPYLQRTGGLARLFSEGQAESIYLLTKKREEILHQDGRKFFVHPGLYQQKCTEGQRHPLVRAVRGEEDSPQSLVDATLGQAGDALFLSGALALNVTGLESSPVLWCLQREGLARLANEERPWSQAAARISPLHFDASQWLKGATSDSVDVVYLDPMMPRPHQAQAGFDLLRDFANPAQFSDKSFVEAARVARQRVVMKVAASQPVPTSAIGWHRRLRGSAVHYLVHECVPGTLPSNAAHHQWIADHRRRSSPILEERTATRNKL